MRKKWQYEKLSMWANERECICVCVSDHFTKPHDHDILIIFPLLKWVKGL